MMTHKVSSFFQLLVLRLFIISVVTVATFSLTIGFGRF